MNYYRPSSIVYRPHAIDPQPILRDNASTSFGLMLVLADAEGGRLPVWTMEDAPI